jgi:hypothetical protein
LIIGVTEAEKRSFVAFSLTLRESNIVLMEKKWMPKTVRPFAFYRPCPFFANLWICKVVVGGSMRLPIINSDCNDVLRGA